MEDTVCGSYPAGKSTSHKDRTNVGQGRYPTTPAEYGRDDLHQGADGIARPFALVPRSIYER